MGVRFIKGLQKEEGGYMKAAACAKHFAVHSGPEGQRHSFDAKVSKKDLYETYLPAFRACVQEGHVEAVMGAYNRVNGKPCCGSRTLLKEILRDEWGFEGHVVSDCWAIQDFHENHKVTTSPEKSASMALENGCDLNCGCTFPYLRNAVRGGFVGEELLDQAVNRLMETRIKLGTLEEEGSVPFDSISYEETDTVENREFNRKAAEKCILKLMCVFTTVMFLLSRLIPELFVRMFTSDGEYFTFSIWAIHTVTLMIIPLGFQYVFVDGLTAMAKTKTALCLSVFRKSLYAAGTVVLPMFFSAQSAFYAEPLADIVGSVLSTTVFLLVINKHLQNREQTII